MMKSPYEDPLPEEDGSGRSPGWLPRSEAEAEAVAAGLWRPWVWVCLTIAAISVLYRLLVQNSLEQTALLFIGLPTLMAILLGGTPNPQSVTGRIVKGMTLAMLLSGILLVEGIICILMAAPLFYLVGIIIGGVADYFRWRSQSSRLHCVVGAAILLTALEGTTDGLSFDRHETVVVSKEFDLAPAQVREALAGGPGNFDLTQLPGFLKLGFPRPQRIDGGGIDVGSRWTIHFAGGEGEPGDLTVEVTESEPGRIRFTLVEDTSHIAHWMRWQDTFWEIEAIDGARTGTKVTMTIRFVRELDPAWYFKPVERHGVRLAGRYFLDQLFERPNSRQ